MPGRIGLHIYQYTFRLAENPEGDHLIMFLSLSLQKKRHLMYLVDNVYFVNVGSFLDN